MTLAGLQFDQNFPGKVAPLLEASGHDIVVMGQVGDPRMADDALLLSAVKAGRVFVTHNRKGFRMLHDAWTTWPTAFGLAFPPHPGILILDQAPPGTLATVIAKLLDRLPPEQLASGIFWWHHLDGWRQSIARGPWMTPQTTSDT